MSTNDPMTQEQLDAIQERLDCGTPTTEDVRILLAEVERLRALTTIDRDMLARAQREYEWSGDMRYVLKAALGTGGVA